MTEIVSVSQTDLKWPKYTGKVRDTYDLGGGFLLIISTDRISAFDVIFNEPVPGKGVILNEMSKFWFSITEDVTPNHLNTKESQTFEGGILNLIPKHLVNRSMIVKKAERVNIECVVRGHIAGSAWEEYVKDGTINKSPVKQILHPGDAFLDPIFTPTTKADAGHDQSLSDDETVNLIGTDLFNALKSKSLELFNYAYEIAKLRGMILADTKFEFGFLDGELILIDELLTPDSSRFWDENEIQYGRFPPAYDKQFLRQWLMDKGWNQEPPPPALPNEIIIKTRDRYLEAYKRITGTELQLKKEIT
jgi:phosphoribosylaminoimidazole-succinocarboxamide synthase